MSELNKKVARAINLLKLIDTREQQVEVCYSGGKDSDVILRLAQLAGIRYKAIYKNTTIDPPGTIKHCIEAGAEVIYPKKTFLQMVEEKGLPSRWSRFCCSELKEYKILEKQIVGVRRDESKKRAARYKEPTICRTYRKGQCVEQFLPILEWTLDDVSEFVKEENITLAPHYYDEDGEIDFSMRLGCIGCPLKSRKKRIRELKAYPKLLRQMVLRCDKFKETHPDNILKSGADVMYLQLFCNNVLQFIEKKHTIFGEIDTREELERIFKVSLRK